MAHAPRCILMDPLVARLIEALGPASVEHGPALQTRPRTWRDSTPLPARVRVAPRSTAEVSQVLALCYAHDCPVVIHGGTTGLAAGEVTTDADLVLALERMTAIEDIDVVGRTVVVQGGCRLQTLQEAVAARGLYLPLDLGARGTCTIGGNVATNAGGLNVIRWGMARALVLGLEAVLADGTVVSSMNRMLKNNTGYDLKQLFIGSEGTLGVVTRVVLRLAEPSRSVETALLATTDLARVAQLLKHAESGLGGALSSFEVIWGDYYRVNTAAPRAAPLSRDFALYVLIEARGADPAGDPARFAQVVEAAFEAGLVVDATIAKSGAERERFWAIRENFEDVRAYRPLFTYDVSLPIAAMQAYLDQVEAALKREWVTTRLFVVGHLGDGNLHLVVSPGAAAAGVERERAHAASDQCVYPPLAALGGAVSAEHGIGLEKKAWMPITRSAAEIALMRQVKRTLDPKNLLNRGKVLDG
jgi:FAD/FMN-containing dehydrogenase